VAADNAAEPKEIPMSRQKSKRPTPSLSKRHRSSARTAARSNKLTGPQSAVSQRQQSPETGRAVSKQARIIAMLRAPRGATIQALIHATGWQPHSVRGFLAGVVRKKLGLNLVSAAAEGARVYRIADRTDVHADAATATERA
jgi:Protein of unknown function (DUF3489)